MGKSFNVSGYLVIEARKSYGGYVGRIAKITSGQPSLTSSQIAVKVNVTVPNAFFERLTPVINIDLPEEAVVNPDVNTVIDLTAIEVADKLKLEVNDVQDWLRQLVDKKREEYKNG